MKKYIIFPLLLISVFVQAQLSEFYKRKVADRFELTSGTVVGLTVKITDSIAGGLWMQTTRNIPYGTTVRTAINNGWLVLTTGGGTGVPNDSTAFARNESRHTTFLRYGDKVNIGSSATPDSSLKATSVEFTRGLKVGYDAVINGVTVGLGYGNNQYGNVMGYQAGNANTTGANIAIGYQSLLRNTNGTNNVGIGFRSLQYNVSGQNNISLGHYALSTLTGGSENTLIGNYTISTTNAASNRNTGLGYNSLCNNTIGNSNTAIGHKSLYSNTSGYSNIAVGVRALYSNTTKSNLVAVGDSALYSNVSGEYNTAIGSKSLLTNISGSNNTAVGHFSQKTTTGSGNTTIGKNSGYLNSSGNNNTLIGAATLSINTTGSNNIAIGYGAATITGYDGFSNRMFLGSEDSLSPGIYFDRTSTKKWGRWNGTMVIKTLPVKSGIADSTLRPDYSKAGVLSMQALPWIPTGNNIYYNTGYVGIGTSAPTSKLNVKDGYVQVSSTTAGDSVSLSTVSGIRLYGNATVWDDIQGPFSSGVSGGNPYPTYTVDSAYYNFIVDSTGPSLCKIYMDCQLPHRYKEGSDIDFHVHYKHETTQGTPTFIIKYRWFNIGAKPGAYTWKRLTVTTGTTANTIQINYSPTKISGAGKTISSMIQAQVYLYSQTGTGNIHAYGFDVHYEVDALGSKDETIK